MRVRVICANALTVKRKSLRFVAGSHLLSLSLSLSLSPSPSPSPSLPLSLSLSHIDRSLWFHLVFVWVEERIFMMLTLTLIFSNELLAQKIAELRGIYVEDLRRLHVENEEYKVSLSLSFISYVISMTNHRYIEALGVAEGNDWGLDQRMEARDGHGPSGTQGKRCAKTNPDYWQPLSLGFVFTNLHTQIGIGSGERQKPFTPKTSRLQVGEQQIIIARIVSPNLWI